jgi:hypothetical protein
MSRASDRGPHVQNCESCFYAREYRGFRRCLRYPPWKLQPTPMFVSWTHWVKVDATMWCGEWRPAYEVLEDSPA